MTGLRTEPMSDYAEHSKRAECITGLSTAYTHKRAIVGAVEITNINPMTSRHVQTRERVNTLDEQIPTSRSFIKWDQGYRVEWGGIYGQAKHVRKSTHAHITYGCSSLHVTGQTYRPHLTFGRVKKEGEMEDDNEVVVRLQTTSHGCMTILVNPSKNLECRKVRQ